MHFYDQEKFIAVTQNSNSYKKWLSKRAAICVLRIHNLFYNKL